MLELFSTGSAKSAEISPCGKYRYTLNRRWDDRAPCVFVMFNPSTADADNDDPTIRRCIYFSRKFGHGGLVVVNLFAWRATNPKIIPTVPDPVGPGNDHWLSSVLSMSENIVAAWGNDGGFRNRDIEVMKILQSMDDRVMCLGLTNCGQPRHPLYMPNSSELQPYRGRRVPSV